MPPPVMGPSGSGEQSPQAGAILALGIIGLVGQLGSVIFGCCCILGVCSWVAFFMGQSARKQFPNCQQTQIGWILGMVGMILNILGILAFVVFMIIGGAMGAFSPTTPGLPGP
jgi:protein-S-isoprenylcysteine O-methyltransferase Ste14